jgi:hypothetical protein
MDVPRAAKILLDSLKSLNDIGADINIMAPLVQALSIFKAESRDCYRTNTDLRKLLSKVIIERPGMRTFISQVIDGFGNGERSIRPLAS